MNKALMTLSLLSSMNACLGQDESQQVKTALDRASHFMMDTVSLKGGFLMLYSEDLSRRWGELPARDSMVWVQDPATVGVGELFLRAHQVTGVPEYLRFAKQAAAVLIYGQHPSGGWHYFIDFDPAGTSEWYDRVGSRCWGWEEYYHYYGNCTFDDTVTVDASRFLLHLYLETLDPTYRGPVLQSLRFLLESQYPNGAWPQRFPLDPEELLDREVGYTAYYTFNDGIILENIRYLLEAHRSLGDDRYRRAAVRGMEFVLLSQLPEPRAGWAQQYDFDLNPAAARSYEPAALSTIDTLQNIQALEEFYLETGDRRYLDAIPPALRWLESSVIPKDHSAEGHTHATFIELESNRPIYGHREGNSKESGRYWNDNSPENLLRGYGYTFNLDVDTLWKNYQRVSEGPIDPVKADTRGNDDSARKVPEWEQVEKIVHDLDDRGGWIEDLSFPNTEDYMNLPPEEFRGYSTATFIRNANLLVDFLESRGRQGHE